MTIDVAFRREADPSQETGAPGAMVERAAAAIEDRRHSGSRWEFGMPSLRPDNGATVAAVLIERDIARLRRLANLESPWKRTAASP